MTKLGGLTSFCVFSLHLPYIVIFLKIFIYAIYLSVLCLSCGMCDLISWPGMELCSPALGVWSLSHWITKEVPTKYVVIFVPHVRCERC